MLPILLGMALLLLRGILLCVETNQDIKLGVMQLVLSTERSAGAAGSPSGLLEALGVGKPWRPSKGGYLHTDIPS